MTSLCLGSFKGSHLIINTEKYQQRLTEYPSTDDGYIHVVGGIVKNNDGQIYLHHHAKLNEFRLPGGKVEFGETFEQALERELQEELCIEVKKLHHISSIKYIFGGVKRCFHLFIVDEYAGTPINNEKGQYDHYRAEIIDSDNSIGYALKIDGTITDDSQDIMQSFVDIYHWYTIVPQIYDDILGVFRYRTYDQTKINLSRHYYLYVDQETKEYYFKGL